MLAEGGALELSGTHDIEMEHLRRVVEVLHDLIDMPPEIVAVQPHQLAFNRLYLSFRIAALVR